MHLNISLIASALIAWASAQTYVLPPSCADSCLEIYLSTSGCLSTDIRCLCLNTAYRENVRSCAIGTCSASDYALLLQDSAYNCQLAGVTVTATATAQATAQATAPNYANPTAEYPSSNTFKIPDSSRKHSGLSSRGKYGLGFGIPAAVLAAIGGIFKACRSRHKKQKVAGDPNSIVQLQEQPKMDQQPVQYQAQWNMQTVPSYQIAGQQNGHGFPTTQTRAELPSHAA